MKKIFWILMLVVSFVSCNETPQETVDRLNREIVKLDEIKSTKDKQAAEARARYNDLSRQVSRMESILLKQKEEYKCCVIQMKDAENKHDMKIHPDKYLYVIKIRIHQTTYTLSVSEYIKNKINDAIFEIPVDKSFYDKCRVGQVVNDPSLKIGSFIFNGDLSVYKVTIESKKVVKR